MELTAIRLKEDISTEDLFFEIDKIQHSQTEYLDIKKLPTEKVQAALSHMLTLRDVSNPIIILNILNLIKNYNDYDESFFSNQYIYFSDFESYIDIRINLEEEIASFQKDLAKYFFSLFGSLEKMEYTILDDYIDMPEIFSILFLTSDYVTLGGIVSKVKDLNTSDFVKIKDSYQYINHLSRAFTLSDTLIESFGSYLKQHNESLTSGEHDGNN